MQCQLSSPQNCRSLEAWVIEEQEKAEARKLAEIEELEVDSDCEDSDCEEEEFEDAKSQFLSADKGDEKDEIREVVGWISVQETWMRVKHHLS